MSSRSKCAIMGTTLILAVVVALQVRLSAYTFTTLDYPGASNTQVLGINDQGHVVGTADNMGFLWKNGRFRLIEPPGATSTTAWAINEKGWIVGTYSHPDPQDPGHRHGFLLRQGVFTDIEFPGCIPQQGCFTEATGINNRGDIVGYHQPFSGADRVAFLFKDGTFTPINSPYGPGADVQAFGINSAGQIVGWHRSTNGPVPRRGFLLAGGVITSLDEPDGLPDCKAQSGCQTPTFGIDDALRLVGQYIHSPSGRHGYVLAGGKLTNIACTRRDRDDGRPKQHGRHARRLVSRCQRHSSRIHREPIMVICLRS